MNTAQQLNRHFDSFKELLFNQIKCLETATRYLLDIKSCIQENNLEALQLLIKNNTIPLTQIEELEEARYALTQECGFERNKQGFIDCINACDNQENTLNQLQQHLFQVMDDLKQATTVNDLLVDNNKKRVQHSLHILTGMTLIKDQTYSNKGTTNKGKRTRTIATA